MAIFRLTTQLQNTIRHPFTELFSIVSESGRLELPKSQVESSFSTPRFQFFYDGYFDLPDTVVAGNFDSFDVL